MIEGIIGEFRRILRFFSSIAEWRAVLVGMPNGTVPIKCLFCKDRGYAFTPFSAIAALSPCNRTVVKRKI
jgi:hypothetical protein